MWLFDMFDLPVKLKKDQKAAAQFRKNLEKDGFTMYQYSIYIRHCGSLESAEAHTKRVKSLAPAKGHVSVLSSLVRVINKGILHQTTTGFASFTSVAR